MKRSDLIRRIQQMGCVFIRHGGNHDWYQNPNTKIAQPVSRHNEIKDSLAKHILKMLSD
ncbi:MAG: addiction module toxin, HicA family [Chloroflexi bacterium RBG_16_57_8]|nr:MAG: addiction module toxin, HicA family [Chloroflexi bacterium RBG_16_57_8]